jgi:hypothetical protein
MILTSECCPFPRETLCRQVLMPFQEQTLHNQEVDQQKERKRTYANTHAKDSQGYNGEPKMVQCPISHSQQ